MNIVDNGTLILKQQLLKDYNEKLDYNGISSDRVASRLHEIAAIGLTEEGGSNRPGFSKEEQRAKEKAMQWMNDLGLEVWQDGAGNVFGRLEGKNSTLPAVMCGSHLDTVPNGGHFDGVLGVLAAIEVAEAWNDTGFQPEHTYEIAIFTDEEGSTFNASFTGSEAVVGIDMEEKLALKDTDGNSFAEVLENIGLNVEGYQNSTRDLEQTALFVEVHIEQGKVLEQEDLPCGVVTGIAGPVWLEITFYGEAGHAGNTPMGTRHDALVAASEFTVHVNQATHNMSETAVATVGKQLVHPNGINVIPGKVTTYVDVRDIYQEKRDRIIDDITNAAADISKKHGIRYEMTELANVSPVLINEKHVNGLGNALEKHAVPVRKLPSGAGHDSMILNDKTEAAMLFTRSKDGISHNPAEWSDLNDCIQTIHVLKTFIEEV